MYKIVFIILTYIMAIGLARAQLAKDYLCLDTKVALVDSFMGNKESLRYARSFVYKGTNGVDTIYLFERKQLGGKRNGRMDTLMRRANGKKLFISGYLWNGHISEDEPNGNMITIIGPGETKVSADTNAFDMGVDIYVTTTTYLPTYKLPNGLEFTEVVQYDAWDKKTDRHYITHVAKGQGEIDLRNGEIIRTSK